MKSFIRTRVVKSYDVEVAGSRLVECRAEEFQQLSSHLTVLTALTETETKELSEFAKSLPVADSTNQQRPQDLEELAEAEAEAQTIIAEAQAQARIIVQQAQNEAAEILAKARAEDERFRQELREAIRAEVIPQAQAEGFETGRQLAEDAAKQRLADANALFTLAQRAVQEEFVKVDDQLLRLALKIVERIVRGALAVEPQRLLDIIRALTLLPQDKSGWSLRVSAQDAAWLANLSVEDGLPCPWIQDETLAAGDCFLECQEGVFDARLDAELSKFEQLLQEELQHGEVGTVGAGG